MKAHFFCNHFLRIVGMLLAVAMLFVSIGCQNSEKTDTASSSRTAQITEEKSQEAGYNYKCKIGDKIYQGRRQGNIGIALFSIEATKEISTSFNKCRANGVFQVLKIVLSNYEKENISLGAVYLIDDNGRKFSTDIDATSTVEIAKDKAAVYSLNPDETEWIYQVFDIPKDANIIKIQYEGFLDNNVIEIPFRVNTK